MAGEVESLMVSDFSSLFRGRFPEVAVLVVEQVGRVPSDPGALYTILVDEEPLLGRTAIRLES